jgi:hypothetical protein
VVVPALCPLLSLASLILHLAGAPIPAITCLSLALLVLPPVQCLIKLAVALTMALIVGAVELLLRLFRDSDRLEAPLLSPPPIAAAPIPAAPIRTAPGPSVVVPPVERDSGWRGQARPTGELTWQGQASPFIGRRWKWSGWRRH